MMRAAEWNPPAVPCPRRGCDGGDDGTDLIHRHLQPIQQTKRHDGAALGVVGAVDDVADVMEKSGDLGKLHLPCRILQRFQDHGSRVRCFFHMGKGMLRVADGSERHVGTADVLPNVRILADIGVSYMT